jgi:hypothetical protein
MTNPKDKPIKKVAKKFKPALSIAMENNQNARKYYPDDLAIKLDEWSKRENARWIGDFAIENEIDDPSYFSKMAQSSELFSKSLRLAKLRIASRLRQGLNNETYNASLFHREIGLYDHYLKAHDREEREFEASLKNKDNASQVNEEAIKSAASVLAAIAAFQSKKSS